MESEGVSVSVGVRMRVKVTVLGYIRRYQFDHSCRKLWNFVIIRVFFFSCGRWGAGRSTRSCWPGSALCIRGPFAVSRMRNGLMEDSRHEGAPPITPPPVPPPQ